MIISGEINMKGKHFLSVFAFISCYAYGMTAYAFDDTDTHPRLTKAAVNISQLDDYLIRNIGLSSGVKYVFKGIDRNGIFLGRPVQEWLWIGSKDEDYPTFCRASNHFHNPIHSGDWLQSQMSDSVWVDLACGTNGRYSNVTWATGFTVPGAGYIGPRIGKNVNSSGMLYNAPQDMGWDNAREYFYGALTATDPAVREERFANSFRAIGQVMHLLQDMAVPAHVRNDMESHLFNAWNPKNWGNEFEKYVVTDYSAVSINPTAFKPTFAAPMRPTDFWDKNIYTGANPSDGTKQGLAEYANANYFSNSTISGNYLVSANHQFPYPKLTNSNYICTDYLPGSTDKTKYISRKPCPTNGDPVDHFVALSMVMPKILGLPSIPSLNVFALDNNVHKTYAKELLPRAVGYSAALLDYFFRGTIKLKSLETASNSGTIKLSATNITTNSDLMTNGTVALVLRYRQILNADQSDTIPNSDYSYKVYPLSGNTDIPTGNSKEFTFDISADPLPDWANDVTGQLVYRGQLGNEADAVAVGLVALKVEPKALEIALPTSGVYAATTGSGFNRITLNAMTSLLGGLSQPDGVFQLVLVHRYSASDPFQSVPVSTTPVEPNVYHVIRAAEATGIKSLQQGVAKELKFDITDTPLPLWASDVHIYLVYKHASDPDSKALAVGYLDVAEPTPVDAYNNTDFTCLDNKWYRYDDPAAMAIVDADSNGVADRSDIYPHTISNITFQGGPAEAGTLTASPQQNNLAAAGPVQPGQMLRLGYILTDYANKFAFDEQWTNNSTNDNWTTTSSTTTFSGTGFTNQAGMGLTGMYNIRGSKMGWGASVVYENDSYPAGSYCDTDLLNQPVP